MQYWCTALDDMADKSYVHFAESSQIWQTVLNSLYMFHI